MSDYVLRASDAEDYLLAVVLSRTYIKELGIIGHEVIILGTFSRRVGCDLPFMGKESDARHKRVCHSLGRTAGPV